MLSILWQVRPHCQSLPFFKRDQGANGEPQGLHKQEVSESAADVHLCASQQPLLLISNNNETSACTKLNAVINNKQKQNKKENKHTHKENKKEKSKNKNKKQNPHNNTEVQSKVHSPDVASTDNSTAPSVVSAKRMQLDQSVASHFESGPEPSSSANTSRLVTIEGGSTTAQVLAKRKPRKRKSATSRKVLVCKVKGLLHSKPVSVLLDTGCASEGVITEQALERFSEELNFSKPLADSLSTINGDVACISSVKLDLNIAGGCHPVTFQVVASPYDYVIIDNPCHGEA